MNEQTVIRFTKFWVGVKARAAGITPDSPLSFAKSQQLNAIADEVQLALTRYFFKYGFKKGDS